MSVMAVKQERTWIEHSTQNQAPRATGASPRTKTGPLAKPVNGALPGGMAKRAAGGGWLRHGRRNDLESVVVG